MKNESVHLKTERRNKEMKINWKVRFRNRIWLLTFIAGALAFTYKVLDTFGIVPRIEQEALKELADSLVYILMLLGIVIDPTTKGTTDSNLAMSYTKPASKLPEIDAQYAEPIPEEEINTGGKMNG